MKKIIKKISAIAFFLVLVNFTYAQVTGDYRSNGSGEWNTVTNWQTYSSSTELWTTATVKPGSNRNVTIRNGHNITLSSTNTCSNLTIESGGTLDATASASIRVGGIAGMNAILQNNGTLGNTISNSLLIVEVPTTAASLTIQGSGTTQVARLRILGGNTQACTLTVNQNVNIVAESSAAFSAFVNSGNLITDDYTITVNADKTVKLLNPNTYFHSSSSTNAVTGGNYTYNINGTLDLSSTTVNANLIPNSSNSLSNVNLNISGLVKLGSGLNLVNSASTVNDGKVNINVASGGLIDATNTTTINYGTNYFKLAGTGKVKRKVDNTDVIFPIGLASSTEPNFVTLNNSGTLSNFTVGLSPTFTVTPTETKVVNRQWDIQPETAGATAIIKLGWGTTAQAAGFNPNSPVSIIRLNGATWDENAANISGPIANIYSATLNTGISNFGAFSVQNTSTLPLKLISFAAKLNSSLTNQVDLRWQTQNEVNTEKFLIERSRDGKDFKEIAFVKSYNTSGNHNYNYLDVNPLIGLSYYRLKQIDLDGKLDYSTIKVIENYSQNFAIYPNPITSLMQITHPESSKGDVIQIVNTLGVVVKKVFPIYLSNITSINLSELKSGTYIVYSQNNGKISTSKFLKE
ncbi:hypothetical protein A5893_16785 [Pedobacter psychrophilus]|uniref:Secretion system C-terminal sorting domain-containing protein n=1 Tax=Pedobacter psychrophilus TaxID=1826909 RepID=A0A179DBW8_9SPHI|nr:T9SS type A sorting domain-containing protein [Pedobacter psychrophilus]OAQ38019.1 hypothetical protein A5893_16785 [Pedobacter psychrophilus]